MFCSKCGKEISDDSRYCYNCGFKIDFVKSSENVEKDSISPINIETYTTHKDTEEGSSIKNSNQTDSSPSIITKHDIKKGYGWFVLLWIYGYGMLVNSKSDQYSGEVYSLILPLLGLVVIFPIYFWFRKYLIKKNFWKGHVGSSSCLSGIVSFILVNSLVVGSVSFIGSHQKGKEINEFMKSFKEQAEILKKQDIVYQKMLEYEPKNMSELKEKMLKIDEYEKYLVKKNNNFVSLTNFLRQTNSKYKKDKSVDEQIGKLEKITGDVLKTSIYSMGMYKKYLITGDERYSNIVQKEYDKQPLIKDEISKLVTNIIKSL